MHPVGRHMRSGSPSPKVMYFNHVLGVSLSGSDPENRACEVAQAQAVGRAAGRPVAMCGKNETGLCRSIISPVKGFACGRARRPLRPLRAGHDGRQIEQIERAVRRHRCTIQTREKLCDVCRKRAMQQYVICYCPLISDLPIYIL